MNLGLVFLTGLTSGGISCFAMQGGLLTGIIANQKKAALEKDDDFTSLPADWISVGLFLGVKLVVHVVLGFLLGSIGSIFSLSLPVQLVFQFLAAAFMLATAGNLLQLHPVFRYAAFQPPRFLQRWIHRTGKSSALFAPALLGALTVFIPCGVTQAMEVSALTAGNGISGALILGAFVLGTVPLFATIGVATSRLTDRWQDRFLRIAAALLILMGAWGINGVLVVLNSPLTLQKLGQTIESFGAPPSTSSTNIIEDGVQKITITVSNSGYSPKNLTVQAGIPVELTLVSNESYSCANAFVLKDFGIKTMLQATDTQTFTFLPEKAGKHTFTCSMGMYTGTLTVTE
jgi:sulfite exporter TauE/SafE/plastocyanin